MRRRGGPFASYAISGIFGKVYFGPMFLKVVFLFLEVSFQLLSVFRVMNYPTFTSLACAVIPSNNFVFSEFSTQFAIDKIATSI